ncbi:MAG: type II toxin-antitoxin system Phd/YefM family antitoxin [Gemmatimonadaceae bacterium]
MKRVPASTFKARCLKLMDEVAATGEPLVVTKHGKPVVRIVAAPAEEEPRPFVGRLKGSILYEGDLISPLDVKWEALED